MTEVPEKAVPSLCVAVPTADAAVEGAYRSRIESIGVKMPEGRLTTKELMSTLKHKANIDLERLTGIKERRVCSWESR